jgi:hypothetical protein
MSCTVSHGPSFDLNLYSSGSIVRHSFGSVLYEASISQLYRSQYPVSGYRVQYTYFFTRLFTKNGNVPGLWSTLLPSS